MNNLILDFFCSFILIATIWWWILYLKQYKVSKFFQNIVGPPGIPLLGNALDFKNQTKGVLEAFMNYTKKYGGLVRIQIGPFRKLLLVSDYHFLEFVLSSTKIIKKSQNYQNMIPWLGTGLLTSDGKKWKSHRRIITPTFHFRILEQFVSSFNSASDIFVEKLRQKSSENLNIYPLVTLCTLDVICETAMGTKVNAQNDHNSKYVQSVKEMGRIIMERAISPQKSNPLLFRFTKDYQIQKCALNVLHEVTNSVIKSRREELAKINAECKEQQDFGIRKRMAFLDLLLLAQIDGKSLSNEEIREEVDTFMFEGHDTTASAISFALYSLATNPEVQNKAYEEQVSIFGQDLLSNVTYSQLLDMKYLDLVIKETLRLYPSVPFYARETNQEIVYENVTIPKGVNITVFAFGIHRDPKYFPEPDKFYPERFEEIDGKMPYAYIPFSAGPRNCIGQKFAILEMKTVLSKILRNFHMSLANPAHKLELIAETVLKSNNGVHIGIRPRF